MLRPLILYGALASVAIALGIWFLADGDEGEQTRVVAQPPDNPSDTAPPPTTSLTELAVQQVSLDRSGGKACGDDGLCVEVTGDRPVYDIKIIFDGEVLRHGETDACSLAALADMTSFSSVDRGGQVLYVGTAPQDAPVVRVANADVRQLKVAIDETDLIHAFVATSRNAVSSALTDTFDSHTTPPENGIIPECAELLDGTGEDDR